jgi:hypothetical protein
VLAAFLRARRRARSRAGRQAAGAAGERKTASALAVLEHLGFVVLHDLRLAGRDWNIDHVVIGPPGVVVVETKQWAGGQAVVGRRHLTVDGRRRDEALEQVGWEVEALQRALHPMVDSSGVEGFLCIHGPRVRARWFWRSPVARGHRVGDAKALVRWLRRSPRRLRAPEIEHLSKRCEMTFVSGR